MVLLPSLRAAARVATCAVSAAGVTVALGAAPAFAAHARPHHASHTAAGHHAGRTAPRGSSHRSHGTARERKEHHHAARAGRHVRHHARPVAEVADAEPVMPLVPQVTLPDLAVTAGTFGGAGPTQAALVPAAAAPRTLAALTQSATSLLDALVVRARSQLGTRYVFGGAEPGEGLDCSSFARYAMEALGIRLPRTAAQQAQIGRPIPRDASMLRPGDLLTFGSRRRVSHVGIYLGEGRFIHASVKHGEVIETTIEHNRSLFRRWQGARRLLAAADDSADDRQTLGG